MALDMTLNPLSLVAFLLTCLGCGQLLAAMFLNNWWTIKYSDGSQTYFGVWSRDTCSADGACISKSGTELTGGQEAVFVSKVFATLAAFLAVCALIGHVIYFFVRRALVRAVAIFLLGSACVFGLLSIFIFVGFYSSTSAASSLGVGFYLYTVGTGVCGLAAGFTAWASWKKATLV